MLARFLVACFGFVRFFGWLSACSLACFGCLFWFCSLACLFRLLVLVSFAFSVACSLFRLVVRFFGCLFGCLFACLFACLPACLYACPMTRSYYGVLVVLPVFGRYYLFLLFLLRTRYLLLSCSRCCLCYHPACTHTPLPRRRCHRRRLCTNASLLGDMVAHANLDRIIRNFYTSISRRSVPYISVQSDTLVFCDRCMQSINNPPPLPPRPSPSSSVPAPSPTLPPPSPLPRNLPRDQNNEMHVRLVGPSVRRL